MVRDPLMFGILNLDKPVDWTSRDVVNHVSRLVRGAKCGHAGTLDPLATGVLLVCVGPATRLVPYIHQHSKAYRATFALGKESPTDDVEGEITDVPIPDDLTRERLQERLGEFVGVIDQVPPVFSAVKIQGKRAYKMARSGARLELAPRPVQIQKLELTNFSIEELTLSIECGTGTYVRAIGRDLARRLGTSAVMTGLCRTRIGPFDVVDSVSPTELDRDQIEEVLLSPQTAIPQLHSISVSDEDAARFRNGLRLHVVQADLERLDEQHPAAVVNPAGTLLGIGIEKQGALAPLMVFPEAGKRTS